MWSEKQSAVKGSSQQNDDKIPLFYDCFWLRSSAVTVMIHGNAHRPKQTDGDQTPPAQHKSPALEEYTELQTDTHKQNRSYCLSRRLQHCIRITGAEKKASQRHSNSKRKRNSPLNKKAANNRVPLGRQTEKKSFSLIQG